MKGKIMYMFRKISSIPTIAVLACGMVASISAPAIAEESNSQGVSVESYTQNLKSQNSKDARDVLQAFNNLSREKQAEYINLLNTPDFMKAIYSNDAVQLQKYGVTVTTEKHGDISSSTAFRAAAANTSHTNTYVHEMSWGPIPTVKLQQTYTVTGDGSTVVSSDSCSAINNNYTGVGNITESTTHSLVNEVGECRTNWKASIPTPLGSVDLSSVQEQQINGSGAVVKENFYDL